MPNPGPASTQTQIAVLPVGNATKFGVFPLVITPTALTASTTTSQNFAATGIGLAVGDMVAVNYAGVQTAGVGIANAYVSAADQLTIVFSNSTAGTPTPAAGTAANPYQVLALRPSTSISVTNPQLSW